jgi:hypothetical protein
MNNTNNHLNACVIIIWKSYGAIGYATWVLSYGYQIVPAGVATDGFPPRSHQPKPAGRREALWLLLLGFRSKAAPQVGVYWALHPTPPPCVERVLPRSS